MRFRHSPGDLHLPRRQPDHEENVVAHQPHRPGTQGLHAGFRHRVGADDLGPTVGKQHRKYKPPGIVQIVSKDREANDGRAVERVTDQNHPVGHRIGADEETALEVIEEAEEGDLPFIIDSRVAEGQEIEEGTVGVHHSSYLPATSYEDTIGPEETAVLGLEDSTERHFASIVDRGSASELGKDFGGIGNGGQGFTVTHEDAGAAAPQVTLESHLSVRIDTWIGVKTGKVSGSVGDGGRPVPASENALSSVFEKGMDGGERSRPAGVAISAETEYRTRIVNERGLAMRSGKDTAAPVVTKGKERDLAPPINRRKAKESEAIGGVGDGGNRAAPADKNTRGARYRIGCKGHLPGIVDRRRTPIKAQRAGLVSNACEPVLRLCNARCQSDKAECGDKSGRYRTLLHEPFLSYRGVYVPGDAFEKAAPLSVVVMIVSNEFFFGLHIHHRV